ncbi:MAG: hypothetical protein HEQ20_28070 [Aphanizomenon flos-aquae KM1D3_PB]|uniref:hypothetical protein n=1 Tax=Aphanizomenon flos-aquae TaxID=1176 RepID=UPI0005425B3E|nr:hypothetical protein [Aphanizomenon flos-aquae]KHG41929.1 hypothetical protein OA07_08355 [Aphanizomenon flos-aquae 2012/KM1/D3]QSV73929.1 MAG: hypothetical protein HEQ20_28070 [Aphanizomenon flos-aquae KM1D3_PB]
MEQSIQNNATHNFKLDRPLAINSPKQTEISNKIGQDYQIILLDDLAILEKGLIVKDLSGFLVIFR